MGIKDTWRDLMGLNDDEYDTDDEQEEIKPQKAEKKVIPPVEKQTKKIKRGDAEMASDLQGQMQFALVKPEKYEDVVSIADHLLEGKTIVLNLESAVPEISRRIVDFLSGVTYALSGQIKKVALGTYIIVPHNVEISGDIMEELGNTSVFY